MSRIGKKPIPIPGGVTVKVGPAEVTVTGPKGSSALRTPRGARVAIDSERKEITVTRVSDEKQVRANHGLARALLANMVRGVTSGFEEKLEIYGTGYNCKVAGKKLHLNVGYSGRRRGVGSQFEVPIPDGVEVTVEREQTRGDNEPAVFVVRGIDRQKVGQFAAEVRAIRKTEPYKGKGIRYHGEHVVRKQGKALTGGG